MRLQAVSCILYYMGKRRKNGARKVSLDTKERILGSDWSAINFNEQDWRQQIRVQKYMKLITMLCISRFKWSGLPNGIDSRYLELTLFDNGVALFFPDKRWHRFVVTSGNFGNVNNYNNPTIFNPIATGYSYKQLNSKECVPIWDNPLRCTMKDILTDYAMRLAIADRALDVSLDNASVPLIIACSETQKLTVQNILRAREEGTPYIYTYDSADINSMFNTFPNTTPFIADKVLNVKTQIWNELVNFLGIQNSTTEKKERLITDEVQAGNEKTNVFRASFLQCRQQACDTINELWLLRGGMEPLSVDWSDYLSGGILDTDGDEVE